MTLNTTGIAPKIYTVSELTLEIKELLEGAYPFIWISGEISNVSKSPAGHFYFTLKDEKAQIQTLIFRGQLRNLRFDLEDGISVTGLGRVSVYEPRGTYQIIFEYLEPKGIGALQIAFEQLKEKLAAEGLFDEKYKRPLPFLAQKISLITSPTGAVVHDMIQIAQRRFPNVQIEVVAVNVQGQGAEDEIAAALEHVNQRQAVDVVIVARGGGSLEDLAPFNSEKVARAIFASHIPVVSAVGHETDFSIADFVADLRAPTPSAAAELVMPIKAELMQKCRKLLLDLKSLIQHDIDQLRTLLNEKSKRLLDPHKRIGDNRIKLDEISLRLLDVVLKENKYRRERLGWWRDRLQANRPAFQLKKAYAELEQNQITLYKYMENIINIKKNDLRDLYGKLQVLSPNAILSRGYSITRTLDTAQVVRDPAMVCVGQELEVLVEKGSLRVSVKV